MNHKKKKYSFSNITWIVLSTIVIKLLLLPFVQVCDADAVSRVFYSISWLENPHWIISYFWAPFHFYLIGFILSIWNNTIYAPIVINIMLSGLTLIPFYNFTKREFNNNGAFVATIFLAISPILFRNSLMSLSETPYLFFVVLSMDFLSRGIRKNSNLFFLISGLCMTIAAGFRYEPWIIMIIFVFIILLLKKPKQAILFCSTAFIFPAIWLIQNYVATNNPLFFLNWAKEAMKRNENIEFESYLRRLWFFPFSWMIALGPPAAFVAIKAIFKSYFHNNLRSVYIWSIPFWIMFFILEYNCFNGVILVQHRFTGTLVVFSLPFVAIYFNELTKIKIRSAWIFGALTIGLSFLYNTDVKLIPRLKDQSFYTISRSVQKNITNESCLIMDFVGWDNTYYIELQSKLQPENIFIVFNDDKQEYFINEIKKYVTRNYKGFALLRNDSKLYQLVDHRDTNLFSNFYDYDFGNIKTNDNKKIILIKWSKVFPNKTTGKKIKINFSEIPTKPKL